MACFDSQTKHLFRGSRPLKYSSPIKINICKWHTYYLAFRTIKLLTLKVILDAFNLSIKTSKVKTALF